MDKLHFRRFKRTW